MNTNIQMRCRQSDQANPATDLYKLCETIQCRTYTYYKLYSSKSRDVRAREAPTDPLQNLKIGSSTHFPFRPLAIKRETDDILASPVESTP